MKFIIAFAAVLAVAAALPTSTNHVEPTVLRYDNDNIGVGHYNYHVEQSDGISQHQHAELKHVPNSEYDSIAVRGSYQWTAPDGVTYTVNYVADENGFQPEGTHLPVAPVV